ncbi:dihydropteroate synthase [Thalassoporum mexicanum PCC 7367]|uniref:dihydropteroate synthase n=1 Tax=Thalassoporum mexicanum TaxID=3457544 RepID=UPI00029FF268|nr:dihydropteroate synthase [Pseudanabaena sp. PCC 7367]AFY71017.1 dihydropteroate synthase [Pseudanabaena sp. PCC 7367]
MTLKPWHIRDRTFAWGTRTYLMGILNVTPDSFSDGGLHDSLETAIAHANQMVPYIDMLDIGGESTRPGAAAVSVEDELARVIPAIEAIRVLHPDLPISIDTTKAEVADAALQAGADLVNDVAAGRFDLEMLPIVAKHKAPYILMHMQGSPRTMQANPVYGDVVQDVKKFLRDGVMIARAAGIEHLAIDPGIGFGKTLDHNLALLRELACLQEIATPILVGVSRKSFIGKLCCQPDPQQRVLGTAAACAVAIANGADILRVHDPKEISDICRVTDPIYRSNSNYVAPEQASIATIKNVGNSNPKPHQENTNNTEVGSDAQILPEPNLDSELDSDPEQQNNGLELADELVINIDQGSVSNELKVKPKKKSSKTSKKRKQTKSKASKNADR